MMPDYQSFSTPNLPNPMSQFLQVGHVHADDKLLPVDVMNGQDVVLVEHNLVSLIEPV